MSHDPSEIILICWFGAQETFIIIINYNGSWTFLRDQKNHASTDAFSDFNILFLPHKRQDSQRHKHQKDTVKKLKINTITVKIVMVCEFSMT